MCVYVVTLMGRLRREDGGLRFGKREREREDRRKRLRREKRDGKEDGGEDVLTFNYLEGETREKT